MDPLLALSIVVCTCDRYDLLEGCVESILRDPSFNSIQTELIVIDNTPPQLRRRFEAVSIAMRVITWEPPGLSGARNCGIRESRGEIIGFVDDDARVDRHWCAAVINAFAQHPKAVICGGRTRLKYPELPLPSWFHPRLERMLSALDLGNNPRRLWKDEWIVGTNMAVLKSFFTNATGFNESLGRRPGTLLSNDETELISRVGRSRTYYVPEMSVEHLVSRDRMDRAWFEERSQAQATSDLLTRPSEIDIRLARSELSACRLAFPHLAASTMDRIKTPEDFVHHLRIVYLQQLLADQDQSAKTSTLIRLRIELWRWTILAAHLADRLGLMAVAAHARLAWRGRSCKWR